MPEALTTYRRKRDFTKTPEPAPAKPRRSSRRKAPTFVVQEHHARALHWDFRLERDGVLVSWAVPKGLPLDPKTNHLAVMTEDHPLSYGTFEGEIPKGEYGGGQVILWDHGTYECEKWDEREVKFVLHGEVVDARIGGQAARDRPRHEDAVPLQAEVPVERRRVVLLDDEARRALALELGQVRVGLARRLGRLPEVPHRLVLVEGHPGSIPVASVRATSLPSSTPCTTSSTKNRRTSTGPTSTSTGCGRGPNGCSPTRPPIPTSSPR